MPVLIRLATKADAELIADLSRQTFYDSFIDQNTKENMDKFLEEQFTRDSLIAEVGSKDNIFMLAYMGEEVVGYTRLRDKNQPPELASFFAINQSVCGSSPSMNTCVPSFSNPHLL